MYLCKDYCRNVSLFFFWCVYSTGVLIAIFSHFLYEISVSVWNKLIMGSSLVEGELNARHVWNAPLVCACLVMVMCPGY